MLVADLMRRVMAFSTITEEAYCEAQVAKQISTCAWFSHGRSLAVGCDNEAYILCTDTGRITRIIDTNTSTHPDSDVELVLCSCLDLLVLVDHSGRISGWTERDLEPVFDTTIVNIGFQTACFSPDGRRFATGACTLENSDVILWSSDDGTPIQRVQLMHLLIHMDWSPDGCRICSATKDDAIVFWNVGKSETGMRRSHELRCGQWVDLVRFFPNDASKMATMLCACGNLLIWHNVDDPVRALVVRTIDPSPLDFAICRSPECLSISFDGRVIAAGWENSTSIKTWTELISMRALYGSLAGRVVDCSFGSCGRLSVATREGAVQLWNVNSPWNAQTHRYFDRKTRMAVRALWVTVESRTKK